MRLLIINGPNINMLGIREPAIYGTDTYADLCEVVADRCRTKGIDFEIYQSNHEGDLVTKIQEAYGKCDGIVINPGAYTPTSIAILDALRAVDIPTVEVHLSDIHQRETFRNISYVSLYAEKVIAGKKSAGYLEAIDYLVSKYK